MFQKLFSRYKKNFLLIGFLIGLWWWVKYIQEQQELFEKETDAPIILPDSTKSIHLHHHKIPKTEPQVNFVPQGETHGTPKQKDDLRRIEGIGPKISNVLIQAGVDSYEKLSKSQPDEIRRILEGAKMRLAQPDTWPEQALLAAKGNWSGLENLQSQLKGGRRV